MANFFTGKKAGYETDPYGTWNPLQRVTGTNVSDYLNRIIKEGAPTYTGDYTAPLTTNEQEMISRNARMSALGEQGLEPLLRGEFPEDYYQQHIYKPAMKQYTEDIQPLLEEQYAGSGGYWGGARAGAVSKGYRDLTDKLISERANLGYQAMRDVPTAIQAANQLASTESQVQQIPRLIQQYGLDQQYNEWTRAQGVNQEALNQALNFLNISTVTSTYKPGEQSMFGKIAPMAGTAIGALVGGPAGAMVGSQIGTQVGGVFDQSGTQSSGGGQDLMTSLLMTKLLGGNTGGAKTVPDIGQGNMNRINAFYNNLYPGLD